MKPHWPPRWQREGEDPDYRFSLANERTFLAWLRTGLALLAGAVALVQLVPPFRLAGARTALGILLAVLGLMMVCLAYTRWAANEKAMRTGGRLSYPVSLPILSFTLALVGVLTVVLVAVAQR
ncbi:MAG: YidH family protein [Jatrophihabitantaceae bacterium]